MMTIEEIVAKRRASWEKRHDIEYDKVLVQSAVEYIHTYSELRREIVEKPWELVQIAFTIVDKKKKTVPFFFNEVQQDFVERLEHRVKGRPFFILKGRQQGFTSLITAIQLAFAITNRNFSGMTVANTQENTDTIFNDKARVVYERLPGILRPHEKFNNRKEYFFDLLNSSWRVATATKELGRSKTLNFCHLSESAFYECSMADLQKSLGEAFTQDAIIVYETTANGYNEAKDLWDSNSCENVFYEWYRTTEYESDDLSVLADLSDSWIQQRVAWLMSKGIVAKKIAWYVKKYNAYLDKSSIKQEYPCTPEEAFIASGECEFGNELVQQRITECKQIKPIRRGYFDYKLSQPDRETDTVKIYDIRWVDDDHGEIIIHHEPVVDDKKGVKPYAIGGDTAGEGSDYYTAKVIDNITGESVATYRKQKTDDDLYADQIYCLGRMYNDAIIGIEVNFSYEPTQRLRRLDYPNLYYRERMDSETNRLDKRFGFKTTSLTRPMIISGLKRAWRESDGLIECDIDTLNEMLTFVKNDKGKPEAMIGKHDDLVMAKAIAHQVREQGSFEWKEPIHEISALEKLFPTLIDDTETQQRPGTSNDYIEWGD